MTSQSDVRDPSSLTLRRDKQASEHGEQKKRAETFVSALKYLVHPKETAGYQIFPGRKHFPEYHKYIQMVLGGT